MSNDSINYYNPLLPEYISGSVDPVTDTSNETILTELALLRAEIAKTKDLIKELQVCLKNS